MQTLPVKNKFHPFSKRISQLHIHLTDCQTTFDIYKNSWRLTATAWRLPKPGSSGSPVLERLRSQPGAQAIAILGMHRPDPQSEHCSWSFFGRWPLTCFETLTVYCRILIEAIEACIGRKGFQTTPFCRPYVSTVLQSYLSHRTPPDACIRLSSTEFVWSLLRPT